MRSIIKPLNALTANKIAAGEVIDRPSSIIKECIENSIDAKASSINIHIINGGHDEITITDNGTGIFKDDLKLAPLRHHTSKITTLEDIYTINSFGFRGEALAAICHAADVDIQSKTENDTAYKISISNGNSSDISPTQHALGTTVSIKNLFAHMPVRKKFLKRPATEFLHIYDCISQFALIHPKIDFRLFHNNEEELNSCGISDQKQLIRILYGKKTASCLISIDHSDGIYSIKGEITDPTFTTSNRSKQMIAINNRIVRNAQLLKAIETAFHDYIPARRFPLVVLNILIDSTELDVNVHPQKLDIKFSEMGELFNVLNQTIKHSLTIKHSQFEPLIIQNPSSMTNKPIEAKTSEVDITSPVIPVKRISLHSNSKPSHQGYESQHKASDPDIYIRSPIQNKEAQHALPIHPTLPEPDYIQVLNTYILLKTQTGFIAIDQHAVHERILYEQFKQNVQNEKEQQHLLIPEIVELSSDLMDSFQNQINTIKDMLFEIEEFGKNTLKINAIPVPFVGCNISEIVIDILQLLAEVPNSNPEVLNQRKEELQMKACKAAIKAGKELSNLEIRKLCQDLLESPNNFTCPHGRPLFISYNKKELEKMFLRS